MTPYTDKIKMLDEAFKAARAEYTQAVTKANGNTTALEKAAQIWTAFHVKKAALIESVRGNLLNQDIVSSAMLNNNALELLKSGIMTARDYERFVKVYAENATMSRLISLYAAAAAAKTEDATEQAQLNEIAKKTKSLHVKELDALDTIEAAADTCTGRGAESTPTAAEIVTASKKWEELTTAAIAVF